MSQQERQLQDDEINLYDYYKVIAERKKLVIGLFIISVISAAVISLLMPKIYRGEAVLKLTAKEVTAKELVSIIGKIDREKRKIILPNTHHLVTKIDLKDIKDSTDKLRIVVDSKKIDDVPNVISELIEYNINDNPLIKRLIEQEKERLLKQSEEISKNIEDSKGLIKTYETMLKREKFIPVGFNPVDLMKSISNLQIEKILVEHAIKNLKAAEVVSQYISNKPVKPRIKMNIVLAGVTSLFTGIFLAFFIEYLEKVKASKKDM